VLFHMMRGEQDAANAIAAEMLELAQGRDDALLLIPAHRARSATALHGGRFAAARENAERVLALYDPAQHRGLASLYSFDQRVVALGYLSAALLALGYPDQARRRSHEQLAEAQSLTHPNTLAQALSFACNFYRVVGEIEVLQQLGEALVAVATEHGLPHFLANGRRALGWVLIQQGNIEQGITELKKALIAFQDSGDLRLLAHVNELLADAYISAGRPSEALSCVAESAARMRRPTCWTESEWHRRRGRLALSLPQANSADAEACFRRAVEVARNQGAKTWELRAATSLARLWRDRGKRSEAYDLLAPVYGWFTEGFDTADLKDAKTLLDQLG